MSHAAAKNSGGNFSCVVVERGVDIDNQQRRAHRAYRANAAEAHCRGRGSAVRPGRAWTAPLKLRNALIAGREENREFVEAPAA